MGSLRFQQSGFTGNHYRSGPRIRTELAVKRIRLCLDRILGEVQQSPNLPECVVTRQVTEGAKLRFGQAQLLARDDVG